MEGAYAVDCQEEEKTLIVQTFSKPETANAKANLPATAGEDER